MKDSVLTDTYTRPVKVNDLQSCKRLFSRLITMIQTGEIADNKAKLLIYALSNYVSIYKDIEFEERISVLEKSIQNR